MDTVNISEYWANRVASADQNLIDPSGFQRFCEGLNVDITGVITKLLLELTLGSPVHNFLETGC